MKLVRKTFKLLILGIVLIFLSIGYRLLGDKNNNNDNDTEGKNLINSAKADVPQPGGGGGACEGTGPSEGGSDGCGVGDG